MTLFEIIKYLKTAALNVPNVHSVVDEFTDLNTEDQQYSACVLQIENSSRIDEWMYFTFYLGYVDRLLEDKSNENEIYSYAIDTLNRIYRAFKHEFGQYDASINTYVTFTQRFLAECAGAYATLTIQVPADDCEINNVFEKLNKTVYENGTYHWIPNGVAFDEANITIAVPTSVNNQEKSITITNGGTQEVTYDQGTYTGMSKVTCTATVNSGVDANIKPENIKDGVTILGVEGTFEGGSLETVNVTPTNSSQVITPGSNFYGLGQVNVADYSVDDIYNNLDSLLIGTPSPGAVVVPNTMGFGGSTSTTPWASWDFSQKTNWNNCFTGVNLSSFPDIDMSACTSANNLLSYATITTSAVNKFNLSLPNCTSFSLGSANISYIGTINLPKVSNASHMFYMNSSNLKQLDTLNIGLAGSRNSLFQGCYGLTNIPDMDWTKVTNAGNMFYYDWSITTNTAIDMNLSNCTNMSTMFYNCSLITKLGIINCSSATNINGMFLVCTRLQELGGFTDLGKAYTNSATGSSLGSLDLSASSNITRQSCLNVFNSIYDMSLNTAYTYTPMIKLKSAVYSLLSAADIAIATNKGWTVASA